MPITVLVADDHEAFRRSLISLLERSGFQIVAEAADGKQAVRLAKESRPQVAILDLKMPGLNGLEAGREIVATCEGTRAVLLTVHCEDQYVLAALRAGMTGFVAKSRAAAELLQAIPELVQGSIYLSPRVCRAVVDAWLAKERLDPEVASVV